MTKNLYFELTCSPNSAHNRVRFSYSGEAVAGNNIAGRNWQRFELQRARGVSRFGLGGLRQLL